MNEDRRAAALAAFALTDMTRRAQGNALDLLGFGPQEQPYRVIASAPCWRLRYYGGFDLNPPLLIIAAPIKRAYIWDLMPSASPIRFLLDRGLHVYLLEWQPPPCGAGTAGLEFYADRGIAECVKRLASEHKTRPFLVGHSLGGSLAAIYAALHARSIRGLLVLGAPLCFQPHSSEFRDAVVAMAPLLLTQSAVVPGSAISQLSAWASPDTFVWSRLIDEAFSSLDRRAAERCMRVERWALDEVALSGLLVRQVVQWLYQENRLCRGTLRLHGKTISPATARVPTFAVVNAADAIAPRSSAEPFLNHIPVRDAQLLEFAGETGVGLQHVALLVGPRAHAEVWPAIAGWIEAHG